MSAYAFDARYYRALAALLQYPDAALVAALPEIESALHTGSPLHDKVTPLLVHLSAGELIELQQEYVGTFDRNPSHSLHLFEHIHGESRDRGQAMVDLMQEYQRHGLKMEGDDLPDYVPLFLEFLSLLDETQSANLLGEAVHVLAHVGRKLAQQGSPYAGVFAALELLSSVAPAELDVQPVRDMDEALETFGPGADGAEPLLGSATGGVQPINFYPQRPRKTV
ncbi:nitrate reductase molybdenum cofactor assembly chaperone [Massilia solisilvae]|uniref:Nitrate reductase molybdenum cofactor assembly chaperone n=1 Tax=Massilia solisilvae TaxID=1811225 RepID=A0ABT2BQK9_9BURK|nr:nitrate reductase molybdenum cofactor assembly chaperone [Massilia solisilvae]